MNQAQSFDWDGNVGDYDASRALNNVHSGSAPSLAGFNCEDERLQYTPYHDPDDGNANRKVEVAEPNLMVTRAFVFHVMTLKILKNNAVIYIFSKYFLLSLEKDVRRNNQILSSKRYQPTKYHISSWRKKLISTAS